jgi:heparanase 1
VGSHNGLLDSKTLQPNPDYFIYLLFKKLMGPHVLPVRYDPRLGTRCFAHIDDKDEVTLLLVNMDGEHKEIFVEGQPPS